MKNLTLSLLLSSTPLFAGVEAPIMAPPAPDCQAGFTLGLEALYLRAYQSEGNYDEGDYDFGGRASLGYDFNDCLFIKLTYFGYSSDVNDEDGGNGEDSGDYKSDMDASYLDLVVGEHFKPSDKLTLSPYVGIRWATFQEDAHENDYSDYQDYIYHRDYHYGQDFSGLGVVVGIDATRTLGGGFSLYGTAKQSVCFGSSDNTERGRYSYIYDDGDVESDGGYNDDYKDDRVVFITELGLGAQYDVNFGSVAANFRLGVEGQWWGGLSNDSSENVGLAGFVLGANFRF